MRNCTNVREAGFVRLPAGNTALIVSTGIVHSERIWTSDPSASSRRQPKSAVEMIPNPATAATVAPSLTYVTRLLCTLMDEVRPFRSNVHPRMLAAGGPMMIV